MRILSMLCVVLIFGSAVAHAESNQLLPQVEKLDMHVVPVPGTPAAANKFLGAWSGIDSHGQRANLVIYSIWCADGVCAPSGVYAWDGSAANGPGLEWITYMNPRIDGDLLTYGYPMDGHFSDRYGFRFTLEPDGTITEEKVRNGAITGKMTFHRVQLDVEKQQAEIPKN